MQDAALAEKPRLTSLAHGGGCGCKIAPAVLTQIMSGMPAMAPYAGLMVGTETSDDAAVWRLNDEQALVATTDFFMPVVDDAFDFGRIAATNALSDVYAMATILAQVGWRTALLDGGYRTYRRRVKQALYDEARPLDLVLIDGATGSGKTELLGRLAARGLQTLDLEGLAEHRGSLLGALPGRPQPSQKMFESRLLSALDALDPARPILVEAESSKIGERMIPPVLWRPMTEAPRIVLKVPPEARAHYLARLYADSVTDIDALEGLLLRLPGRHGRKTVAAWRALAEAGELETLAAELIAAHYDPAYARSSRIETRRSFGAVEAPGLTEADQTAAAEKIEILVGKLRA